MEYEVKVEFNELAKSVSSNVKVVIKANDEELRDEGFSRSTMMNNLELLKDVSLSKAKEVFNEAMSYSASKTVLKQ